ncbi:hypothetical protein PIB30_027592 [Stylosanthes scabra]|uniref:Uncharacterized protein n=1 Tax=Stylosanthes scabra TaxID=79078 RepID=A0ABU6XCH5_9FABA|nr:hypothetical protein [Stylosanthes scabra]
MDRRNYSGVDRGGSMHMSHSNSSMSELISFSNDNKGSMEDILYGKEDYQEFNNNSCVYKEDLVVESMRSEIESKELKKKKKKKQEQNMFWSFFQSCFEFLRILG